MSRQVPVVRYRSTDCHQEVDLVADEAPLQIDVNGESLTLTMRTPGDDEPLALGLLYCEGIINSAADVAELSMEAVSRVGQAPDLLRIVLRSPAPLTRSGWERRFPSTSSCGVCGKTDPDSIQCISVPIPQSTFTTSASTIYALPTEMRSAQRAFNSTGGLHAAALFNNSGELIRVYEDIGRHNAVDKIIGSELLNGVIDFSNRILLISGRASFEIVQKAAVAGIPILCAVSAPSSLAVRLAHDMNITLIGFLRDETMNVYTGTGRIK